MARLLPQYDAHLMQQQRPWKLLPGFSLSPTEISFRPMLGPIGESKECKFRAESLPSMKHERGRRQAWTYHLSVPCTHPLHGAPGMCFCGHILSAQAPFHHPPALDQLFSLGGRTAQWQSQDWGEAREARMYACSQILSLFKMLIFSSS